MLGTIPEHCPPILEIAQKVGNQSRNQWAVHSRISGQSKPEPVGNQGRNTQYASPSINCAGEDSLRAAFSNQ